MRSSGWSVTDRVGPALRNELAIFLARFRSEQRILHPTFGLVDIHVGRNDVEVAHQQRRHAAIEQVPRMGIQRVEPVQLIVELRPRLRIAVGRVHVADQDPADRRLDVSALLEVRDRREARGAFRPDPRRG